jgi:predicted PurR-regulated permease PerM
MKDLLAHPWIRVLLIATTIAMCSFALRETAVITQPIAMALRDVLVPVAVGFAIAYVITPVVDAIARQGGMRRFLAAGMLFAIVSTVVAVTLAVLVPVVIRQGASLAERVFRGEPWTDANRNGRYDAGETFIDGNANGTWDTGVLSSGLVRLEEWQNRIKVQAQLALDDAALSYLALYLERTADERDYLERMVAVARSGAPVEKWPAAPPMEPVPIGTARDFSWPAPRAQDVNEAESSLPEEERPRWRQLMASADAVLAAKHAQLLESLELARSERGVEQEPLARRIREAWKQPLGTEAKATVRSFAAELESADKRDDPAAHRLLTELRGGEGTVGSQTLAALVQQVESAVRGSLQESPGRLGAWTRFGFTNLESGLLFALNAMLVPIYAFFLVLAMPGIRRGIKEYIPVVRRDQTVRLVADIEAVVAAFFRGRLIICTLCSIAAWIGFSAISAFSAVSVPYAVLFALAIGFATTVPLSGILFLVPAVVMTMLQPHATALHAVLVVLVYTSVQVLEAVLIPTIMGREVELHPVILIIALLLCGKLLGVLGLVLAVPIAATCRILAHEFVWPRLRSWAARMPAPAPAVAAVDDERKSK